MTRTAALRRARHQRLLADDIAPCLDALARSTAAGHSLGQALAEVSRRTGPFAQRLRPVAEQHALGCPLHDSIALLRHPAAGAEEELAVATLEVIARMGGAVPGALDRAAVAVRDRRTIAAELQASAAQARLSATVMSALPVLVCAWAAASDASLLRFLTDEPAGRACAAAALVLNIGGWLWMRHLVRSAA